MEAIASQIRYSYETMTRKICCFSLICLPSRRHSTVFRNETSDAQTYNGFCTAFYYGRL